MTGGGSLFAVCLPSPASIPVHPFVVRPFALAMPDSPLLRLDDPSLGPFDPVSEGRGLPDDATPLAADAAPAAAAPEDGIGLCLSGGGYRAMLFHVGTVLRLNELGVLPQIARVSSVSGGSITAAVLGMGWTKLTFDDRGVATNLDAVFVDPVCGIAGETIDRSAIGWGTLLPGSISDRVVAALRDLHFGEATLQDLPGDAEGPRFVINASSLQTGSVVRMSRPYLADYRVGMIRDPKISLAAAVAASAAFPPMLAPCEIDVEPGDFDPDPSTQGELFRQPFNDTLVLADGGVYDNLGMETVWKRYRTVLVSDAGMAIGAEGEPATDWARMSYRIGQLVDNQVRSLRKRALIAAFRSGDSAGAYWGIGTDIADYGLPDSVPAKHEVTSRIALTPTRLKRLSASRQRPIIDWGYAVCDAAVRRWAPHVIGDGLGAAPDGTPLGTDLTV